jgi:hypothetical protein
VHHRRVRRGRVLTGMHGGRVLTESRGTAADDECRTYTEKSRSHGEFLLQRLFDAARGA